MIVICAQNIVLSLPNELLEIFSFLEFIPCIICHGVCKTWRELIPSTKLHPIRVRFLALYIRILETPGFQKMLEWTEENLQSFDREEYFQCLLVQYPVIPEEFHMWILEWPARLVIHCTWPGLPFVHVHRRMTTPFFRRFGVNWIAYRSSSPQLSALVYKKDTAFQTFVPGLYLWRRATETDWLVFAQDEPELFGRVIITNDLTLRGFQDLKAL